MPPPRHHVPARPGHSTPELPMIPPAPFVIEDFRQVYEAVALPVLIIDHATWRILAVNKAAVEQYGYEREEFVGLPVLEVRPPEGRADARRVMSEIPHGFWKTTVVQHVRKDGSVFSADVWSRDTVVDGRNVRIATIHEVTERLQIQQELQQAQKMEVVGRLAGGVAHDVNNALTAITGGLNLLMEDFRGDPDTRTQLEEILAASHRVALLTRGLMAFSRQQVMRAEVCSLAEVVESSVALLHRVLERRVELRTRISPGLWPVRIDPVQFEQVIMNLAVNAQDAMPAGGTLVLATENVTISRKDASEDPGVPAGDYAVLTVRDTGTGMDEITRARIFEPFFTTKPPPEGTGLGLSMSYGIVRQSGGFIRVESEDGVGTTFRILLPRADREPAAVSSTHGAAARGARTVLVVDGDVEVRRFTCRVLGGLGYAVISAASAEEALAMLDASAETPVLLVVSLGLPDRDGEGLADRLQGADPGLGVIFLSDYDLEGDRLKAVSGGRQILPRPFSVGTLTEAVRRVLNDS
ncbi:MAG: PAS domain S-box protein [Gemmatimonadales bacterium]|nr:MAG: PAS domain S-box protein [Gemmatimonadales bacterium]